MSTHFYRELGINEEYFNFRYVMILLEILLSVMDLKYEIRINFTNNSHKNCKNTNKILEKLYSVIFLAYIIGNSMEFLSGFFCSIRWKLCVSDGKCNVNKSIS